MTKNEFEFSLKPEDQLILSCSHSKIDSKISKKISSFTDLDLDWEYIIDMASKHRLRPLLYYNLNSVCPEKVPEDILRYLKDFYNSNAHKNLLFTGELIKIMELLKENNINAFTYKGPVLAHITYGNIGLREFRDIDIFIDKSDALKAKEVMLKNNYVLDPPIEAEDRIYMKLESEYRFKNKNNNVKVEINWNFEGMFLSFSQDPYLLFKKMKTIELSGFQLNTISSNNQILMLSVHCAKHYWVRFSWICDISEAIQKGDIDWYETFESSEKLGIKRILLISIKLAEDLFELSLPEEVLSHINSSPSLEPILVKIKKDILSGAEPHILKKIYLDLKKRENKKDLLKDILNYAKKPSYADFEDLPLNYKFFSFYVLIRPILLFKRYAKEIINIIKINNMITIIFKV